MRQVRSNIAMLFSKTDTSRDESLALDLSATGRGRVMKLTFLELAPDERRVYIEQAALQRDLSPGVMEKDFWV